MPKFRRTDSSGKSAGKSGRKPIRRRIPKLFRSNGTSSKKNIAVVRSGDAGQQPGSVVFPAPFRTGWPRSVLVPAWGDAAESGRGTISFGDVAEFNPHTTSRSDEGPDRVEPDSVRTKRGGGMAGDVAAGMSGETRGTQSESLGN